MIRVTAAEARTPLSINRGYNCTHTRGLRIVTREHSPAISGAGKLLDAGRALEILWCEKCKGSKFVYVSSTGRRRPAHR